MSSLMAQTDTAIRLPEVRKRTGLGKTEIYRLAKLGEFPAPRRISHKVSVWSGSAVDLWVAQKLDPEVADLIG
jgi:prophage regulatory protein